MTQRSRIEASWSCPKLLESRAEPDGVAGHLNLGLQFLIPGVFLVVFIWVAYRLVNVPGFADFLIAVEAEVNKVSWPTRSELFRASMMVLFLIFSLGVHPVHLRFRSWNLLLPKSSAII